MCQVSPYTGVLSACKYTPPTGIVTAPGGIVAYVYITDYAPPGRLHTCIINGGTGQLYACTAISFGGRAGRVTGITASGGYVYVNVDFNAWDDLYPTSPGLGGGAVIGCRLAQSTGGGR